MLQLILEIFFAILVVFGLYLLQRKLFCSARRICQKDREDENEDK